MTRSRRHKSYAGWVLAFIAMLGIAGCDYLDPTAVDNPATTDDDLAQSEAPTAALLPGLRGQFARAINPVDPEVISDNYHKGWKARVDGKPTPILLANYIMRAVPVSAGHHEIEMVFRPKLLLAGIFITAAGWALLAILLWLCRPSKTTPRNG